MKTLSTILMLAMWPVLLYSQIDKSKQNAGRIRKWSVYATPVPQAVNHDTAPQPKGVSVASEMVKQDAMHSNADIYIDTHANVETSADRKKITVFGHADQTVTKMQAITTFRLDSGETRAVARIGDQLVKTNPGIVVLDSLKPGSNANITQIPEIYYARIAGTNQQISYTVFFMEPGPLQYDFKSGNFIGKLIFIPVEVNRPDTGEVTEKTLSRPEDFVIVYGSSRYDMKIDKINWPPYDIEIHANDAVDSLKISVCTISKPEGYSKCLHVKPAIYLSTNRKTFLGFGLQTVPVHISLKGVSKCNPIAVGIEPSMGSVSMNSVTLTDDAPREIILKSESYGLIDLSANNPNYSSNKISITASFPWIFLILSILGGMIGGIGKNLYNEARVTILSLLLGGILGLIAAFAYWGLGIKLIKFSISATGINEAMVFALALIAGFFGLIPGGEKQEAAGKSEK
jgi:hypothetical protein